MSQRLIESVIEGRSLVSCTKDTTVRQACKTMKDKNLSALAVVEKGKLVGIFTERDALGKILSGGRDPDKTMVSEVMAAQPETARASMSLGSALHMMYQGGFRHVPVVDDNNVPLGMISNRDALGADLIQLEHDLEYFETAMAAKS